MDQRADVCIHAPFTSYLPLVIFLLFPFSSGACTHLLRP